MKYINELREGSRMSGIYLCRHRQAAVTKNGKPYENVILQDRTGTIDAKIWEPNSQGIDEFDGVLPFTDQANPQVILREFGMSKNAFKRAVGHLLKEGKIEIRERKIYLKEE